MRRSSSSSSGGRDGQTVPREAPPPFLVLHKELLAGGKGKGKGGDGPGDQGDRSQPLGRTSTKEFRRSREALRQIVNPTSY